MSPAQTYEHPVASIASHKQDVCEDYEGHYRFAPIEEAQVSRAMIKRYGSSIFRTISIPYRFHRYFNTMYERVVSDVVIVGAGSAGLSCAWQLATTRPEVCHCRIVLKGCIGAELYSSKLL
jgi:thiamine thiazole synthase